MKIMEKNNKKRFFVLTVIYAVTYVVVRSLLTLITNALEKVADDGFYVLEGLIFSILYNVLSIYTDKRFNNNTHNNKTK